MTREIAINVLNQIKELILNDKSWLESTHEPISQCFDMAIKSLEAWEKIDDEIASLQDTYSIGNTYTEKLIWENLQAVRKTIHGYLKEVEA